MKLDTLISYYEKSIVNCASFRENAIRVIMYNNLTINLLRQIFLSCKKYHFMKIMLCHIMKKAIRYQISYVSPKNGM